MVSNPFIVRLRDIRPSGSGLYPSSVTEKIEVGRAKGTLPIAKTAVSNNTQHSEQSVLTLKSKLSLKISRNWACNEERSRRLHEEGDKKSCKLYSYRVHV